MARQILALSPAQLSLGASDPSLMLHLRPATINDLELLRRWDEEPHVVDSDPNDDWGWETELLRSPPWREQLIAEVDGRGRGHGGELMRQALAHCFAPADVEAVLIDPLASNVDAILLPAHGVRVRRGPRLRRR